ncbi:centromere protein N isoform X3 [Poecilia formosa]|uniref:centromere protein N isoform X3 n=1 Tax=Poecilia formosa TaxID=48698 RepID=UPI0007B7B773|nr:PREDICTED: centromere protein N isoform X3 [Poecilia formosa]
MDNLAKHLLQRLMRRIPASMLQSTLDKWGRLTAEKRKSLDFTQSKLTITQELVALCEESELTVKHITELEMIYVTENPNQGMWHTFQLLDPEDDAHSVELMQFKEQFKSHLSELKRNVSVKIKKHTDEAVWIRVAWGDGLSRPNHLKATYVVHYLQTPYVFVNALSSKNKPLLLQALTLSTKHQQIKAANLSGQKLTALRDLLMRQYQQVSQPPLMRCFQQSIPALFQRVTKAFQSCALKKCKLRHQQTDIEWREKRSAMGCYLHYSLHSFSWKQNSKTLLMKP